MYISLRLCTHVYNYVGFLGQNLEAEPAELSMPSATVILQVFDKTLASKQASVLKSMAPWHRSFYNWLRPGEIWFGWSVI